MACSHRLGRLLLQLHLALHRRDRLLGGPKSVTPTGHYWLYLTLYAGYLGARTTYWRADLGESKPEAMTLDVTDFRA